jgi:serine/threonine-protein kinase
VKACPTCFRIFPDDAAFCPSDGVHLLPYAEVPAQPAGDDRFLGTTITGRYEVRRIVADGGMGRVYEARDAQLDRRVALKVLHPDVARDAIAVERFKREADISRELPHDHIVDVYDFQSFGPGLYLMVMEYLEGEELRTLLKRETTVSPARLLRIVSQVARGLEEAHQRQIVHRDLKPDNIFLCGGHDGDSVKILDFGSVRLNKDRAKSKLTSLGTTIGSPFYMSPEQAQGSEDLDQRADVFALGAIVYECLAGTVPFSGANGPAILLAILTKNPPPITTRAKAEFQLPPALDDVIDDALAKRPETRTPSVGAFADAMGKAFGLQGNHVDWLRMSNAALEAAIVEARATGAAGAVAVADPFASDPFAAGAPIMPGLAEQATVPIAVQPRAAASAMDDAFANAGALDVSPVQPRSLAPILIGAVLALAAIGGIVFFLVR